MVKDLIIIGVAGSGREVAEAVEDVNSLGRQWNLLGFLDDDPKKQETEYNGYPILGPVNSVASYPTCQFIPVVGSSRDLGVARRMIQRLSLDSSRFATVIHPSAKVSRHAEIAAGAIILQNCLITANARIGRHVLVMFGASITHDCVIDDYVIVAPHAVILGGVHVREGCYIGANSTIIQKVEIGPWSCVGMSAAVFANVPPNTTVMGNPARPLRHPVTK